MSNHLSQDQFETSVLGQAGAPELEHIREFVSTTKELEREEAVLARLLDTEPVDRNAAFAQIDRVTQARSEMERAAAVMTLEMREYLTRTQWEQLPRTTVTTGATGLGVRTPPAGRRGNQ
jgi:hypothetical protein